MARDYVKKGKPASRAKRGAKTAPPPPLPSKKPKAIVFLTLVAAILIGFGYFLWSIKDRAPAETAIETVEKPKNKPILKPLPKVPEEKWEYVKELENKEIEVDVPDRNDQPKHLYQMQCGSFRKEKQANVMKAHIAFVGLESLVKRTEGKKGVWYRVVIGPYEHKRDAEADRHKLQRSKINSCQIWYWT